MLIKSCFYQYSNATIVALEYIIKKYGHELWFNACLRKLMSDLHAKSSTITFKKPLVIYHDNNRILGYRGYHYLISEMDKFYLLNRINVTYLYILQIFVFIFILILLYAFWERFTM